ncbi:zinc ABC transporter ATP-binding protein AztA [Streptomyces sp. NPDC047706]|uniref:zinc ABC transporter ATP-binding protein AztA n=1 Tax=Streptomyces sp. NPDC047706 TaxID=3365486 RepID=UPI00370FF66D
MTTMFKKHRPEPPAGEMGNQRVRFTDLDAGYPGRPVLRQLSADITALAMTALVGPNGSGKSTLLGVLAGVIDATAGRLRYSEGRPPAFVPQRGAVGDALPLTVRQTVEMGRWSDRGPWRRLTSHDRTVVDSAMERLGVTDLGGRQLGELSGGQRQRVLIAQGLAQGSDLLLLDEPTTGLDPEARDRITALLTDLVADGATVVQATHDLEAARSADACLLLSDGRLAGQGPPGQVLTPAALARIWQPALDAGTVRRIAEPSVP